MSKIQPSSLNLGLSPAQLRLGISELEATVNTLVERVNSLECSCQGESDGEPDRGLPSGFPARDYLVAGGIETRAQLAAASREELIALEDIGDTRADQIISARESL